jgi:AcrR family transcriptional regulator
MTTQGPTVKCQSIMQAALELIAEQGLHSTPTSQIAQKADVGIGSLYRYFNNKDDLIHGIHAMLDRKLAVILEVSSMVNSSVKEQFLAMITGLAKYLLENPLEFQFLEQYYHSPYTKEKKREASFNEIPADDNDRTILNLLEGTAFKDLPLPVLQSLVVGPLILSIQNHLSGIQLLDDNLLNELAECCWEAVSKGHE